MVGAYSSISYYPEHFYPLQLELLQPRVAEHRYQEVYPESHLSCGLSMIIWAREGCYSLISHAYVFSIYL